MMLFRQRHLLRSFSCHATQSNWTPLTPQGHNLHQNRAFRLWSSSDVKDWNKAVSEAEKIVGYPTSFLSLRCFLSDELSNVALHMRKLVGTKHPLLKTARKFFYDGKHNMQTRGLIVLLISKTAGPGQEMMPNEVSDAMISGIYPSQRSLAEITEMIHTANLIHKGVVNLDSQDEKDGSRKDMEFGNKMAVLSGDFLLANASNGLADLRNTYVVELISSAIGDLMEAEFSPLRDRDGLPVIPDTGATVEDWEKLTFLQSGSLLAKACKSAMLLASHNEEIQTRAYTFGKHAAFAYQIREDMLPFLKRSYEDNGNDNNGVSVTSLPVIMQLQKSPSILKEAQQCKHHGKHAVIELVSDKAVLDQCKSLCLHHCQIALQSLQDFEISESRTALENIVHAVSHL